MGQANCKIDQVTCDEDEHCVLGDDPSGAGQMMCNLYAGKGYKFTGNYENIDENHTRVECRRCKNDILVQEKNKVSKMVKNIKNKNPKVEKFTLPEYNMNVKETLFALIIIIVIMFALSSAYNYIQNTKSNSNNILVSNMLNKIY